MDQKHLGVLLFCNDIRHQLGRQPVSRLRKGLCQHPFKCPVAATINFGARTRTVSVGDWTIWTSDHHLSAIPLPSAIHSFTTDFDNGELPELQGSGWAA